MLLFQFRRHIRLLYAQTILRPVNPLVTNDLSHSYYLDESTFILRGIGKIMVANRIAPDGTPRFAAILFAYVPLKGHQAYRILYGLR